MCTLRWLLRTVARAASRIKRMLTGCGFNYNEKQALIATHLFSNISRRYVLPEKNKHKNRLRYCENLKTLRFFWFAAGVWAPPLFRNMDIWCQKLMMVGKRTANLLVSMWSGETEHRYLLMASKLFSYCADFSGVALWIYGPVVKLVSHLVCTEKFAVQVRTRPPF